MKAAKQDLLNRLIPALAPHLMLPLDQPLPKGISKTLDHLADQLLREQARRAAASAGRVVRPTTASDQLVQLLNTELYDSEGQESSVDIPAGFRMSSRS